MRYYPGAENFYHNDPVCTEAFPANVLIPEEVQRRAKEEKKRRDNLRRWQRQKGIFELAREIYLRKGDIDASTALQEAADFFDAADAALVGKDDGD